MQYRRFIQDYFLIDEPKTGQLVPFRFRGVQNKYYDELQRGYDIEGKGISAPLREIILKARREGFSSFVLALFAADDILNANPTESLVISYKDDATETFRKRYRNYVLSYAARKVGLTVEQIRQNISVLDQVAKQFLSVDSTDIELAHNKAHFYCGTASARTGGRGGVLQKVLFSEEAHYPDTEKMTAKEVVEGTMRQVDLASGWIFRETTANGVGNYYEKSWKLAVARQLRFKPRFYGWREMYSEAEFKLIASEFTDPQMLRQEYPETPQEAFIATSNLVIPKDLIDAQAKYIRPPLAREAFRDDLTGQALVDAGVEIYEKPVRGHFYSLGADSAEGEGNDDAALTVIDRMSGREVASFANDRTPPEDLGELSIKVAMYFNNAFIVPELNHPGPAMLAVLKQSGYPNIYRREVMDQITHRKTRKIGWRTGSTTKPMMVQDFKFALREEELGLSCEATVNQMLTFVRTDEHGKNGMGAEEGQKDDRLISAMLAWQGMKELPAAYP